MGLSCWICLLYTSFASLLTGTNSKTLPVGVAGYFSMEGMRWDEITAAGIIAVSYTHLDVYKRQVFILLNDIIFEQEHAPHS